MDSNKLYKNVATYRAEIADSMEHAVGEIWEIIEKEENINPLSRFKITINGGMPRQGACSFDTFSNAEYKLLFELKMLEAQHKW